MKVFFTHPVLGYPYCIYQQQGKLTRIGNLINKQLTQELYTFSCYPSHLKVNFPSKTILLGHKTYFIGGSSLKNGLKSNYTWVVIQAYQLLQYKRMHSLENNLAISWKHKQIHKVLNKTWSKGQDWCSFIIFRLVIQYGVEVVLSIQWGAYFWVNRNYFDWSPSGQIYGNAFYNKWVLVW